MHHNVEYCLTTGQQHWTIQTATENISLWKELTAVQLSAW